MPRLHVLVILVIGHAILRDVPRDAVPIEECVPGEPLFIDRERDAGNIDKGCALPLAYRRLMIVSAADGPCMLA